MTRRSLLATPLALLAAEELAAAGDKPRPACQTNAWRVNPADFSSLLAVLDKLKGYGYQGFETGFRNVQGQFANPAEARKKLAAGGLTFFAVHIFLNDYDPATHLAPADLIEKVAAGGAALGAERLILSGAPCPDEASRQAKVAGLNRAAAVGAKHKLRLCYHNHGPEFRDNAAEITHLISKADPAVHFVIDAGHAFNAGGDMPKFFAAHHRRIDGMHIRDFKKGDQVILGEGDFKVDLLAAEVAKAKWTGWLVTEEERLNDVKPGDTAVAPARRQMQKVFGV